MRTFVCLTGGLPSQWAINWLFTLLSAQLVVFVGYAFASLTKHHTTIRVDKCRCIITLGVDAAEDESLNQFDGVIIWCEHMTLNRLKWRPLTWCQCETGREAICFLFFFCLFSFQTPTKTARRMFPWTTGKPTKVFLFWVRDPYRCIARLPFCRFNVIVCDRCAERTYVILAPQPRCYCVMERCP